MVYRIGAIAVFLFASCVYAAERPNILWITSEDNGPHLGCYGDTYADTPHLDALAARGLVYLNAWSNAPVCAPARTAIITGMYPTSLGAQHMRSFVPLPNSIRLLPQYLREAGYYCTNNAKEDYNVQPHGRVWDESTGRAHWRGRRDGQPFFAVFNFTTTHESQIRLRPHRLVHDPAQVRVPAYHPDTPEVRRDWAQYYDKLTQMDRQAGQILRQLEADGLADDTIVFYFGDHGPGMPRCKRTPYNSGLNVPLIVSFPEKWRQLAAKEYAPGDKTDRLVAFVDLAPTILSLAGIGPPAHMQGRAFHGQITASPNSYLHGFRDRMDERYDMVRSTRDKRYVYVRNFMPHRRYGEHVAYMFETPTTQVWQRLVEDGKLSPVQARFWQTKPAEELYDLQADPDEVNNLANSPEQQDTLARLRGATHDFLIETRDAGFLPEPLMQELAANGTIFDMAQDPSRYAIEKIITVAETATSGQPTATGELLDALESPNAAIRYWAILGLLIRGEDAVAQASEQLRALLVGNPSCVAIAAAEALARYGQEPNRAKAAEVLVELADVIRHGPFTSTMALNALDAIGPAARPVAQRIKALNTTDARFSQRMRSTDVATRLIDHIQKRHSDSESD
jgi:arylsulfatase A-like enzyme